MLPELFAEVLGDELDARQLADLRENAEAFGAGLQLVNILKDVTDDRQRRWSFVPRAACERLGIGIENLTDTAVREQAHDAVAPLAIAHAAGASFVRLKVFVGAAMTAEGPRNGLAVEARSYRHELRRDDVAILADVFDRTSRPLLDVSPAEAALMAEKLGADGLILTGGSFADSLERVRAARAAGARRPVLIGGSVTEGNLAEALAVAEGAVVSTSLMRPGASPDDVLQWDADRTRRFMDAVRALPPRRAA